MQKLLNKVAPLGVMTACVIWCCWSQLRELTPLLAATEASLPRIERKLLYPELSPVSDRDPFLRPQADQTPAIENIDAQITIEEEPPFDPRTVLPSIRLDATLLGAKPMAVINGRIHNEGESIVLETAPEVNCRLQRVLSDGIVMRIEQQTYLISYSNTPKDVTEPAPKAEEAPHDSEGPRVELPDGVSTSDELDRVAADSLAHQALPTDGQDNPNSDESRDLPMHAAGADCDFEQDLLTTNKFDELLNNNDE